MRRVPGSPVLAKRRGVRHPEDPFDPLSGTGLGRRLLFNRVSEPKTGKNRVHLDIHAGCISKNWTVTWYSQRQKRSFSTQGIHFYQSVFGATVVRERDPVILKRARGQRLWKPRERNHARIAHQPTFIHVQPPLICKAYAAETSTVSGPLKLLLSLMLLVSLLASVA